MEQSVMRTSDSFRHSRYKLLHRVMKTHVSNLQIQGVEDEKQQEDEQPLVFGLFSYWFLSPYQCDQVEVEALDEEEGKDETRQELLDNAESLYETTIA